MLALKNEITSGSLGTVQNYQRSSTTFTIVKDTFFQVVTSHIL